MVHKPESFWVALGGNLHQLKENETWMANTAVTKKRKDT